LKIPAETQSGRVFRVREKGVRPVRGGAAGDLFCRVVIETPVSLSGEQKELLKRFEASLQEGGHKPREQSFLAGGAEVLHRSGPTRCPESRYSASRAHGANPDSRPA